MKRLGHFFWQYKHFSITLLAALAGLSLQLAKLHTASHWVLGTVASVEAAVLLWGMIEDVRNGSYGIDILAATAIITSVILGQYWAAIVVVLMLTGGESLEDYAEHRAQRELDSLLAHAPQKAHLYKKQGTVDVKVTELKVGDKVLIKPGEVVPVDAVILEGSASFDEASLTGESVPVSKQVKDLILSGAINLDGSVTALVTATSEDSQYQQIIRLVRNASASQAPFVRLADRYSIPFTFAAYAIAVTVWILTGQAIRFLEVIVVATPCPLLLAAPIALISGMSRASKYGIIVKTGSALEKLAEAETIAFDKTGTLTHGRLILSDTLTFGGFEKDEVLALAASLEQSSNHVLAHSIVNAAVKQKLHIPKAKHVQEVAGIGVRTSVKGKPVLVGRASLLEAEGIDLPKGFKQSDIKQTAAYVVVGHELAGVLIFEDEVRENAAATIKQLKRAGLSNVLMLTGDHRATASAVAERLGITNVEAELLPADKLHALDKIKERPLVFVGDGVNDAPVLTAADVGIALGALGSTAASESADMVIMTDDISRVATAVSIAQRTFGIARQSILVGIGISLALMAVFATGKFSPLLGAGLQEIVDVIVIFNALRAHTGKLAS